MPPEQRVTMSETPSTTSSSPPALSRAQVGRAVLDRAGMLLMAAAATCLAYVVDGATLWRFDAGVSFAAALALGPWGAATAIAGTVGSALLLTGSAGLAAGMGTVPLLFAIAGSIGNRRLSGEYATSARLMSLAGVGVVVAAMISAAIGHANERSLGEVAMTVVAHAGAAAGMAGVILHVALDRARSRAPHAALALGFVGVPAAIVLVGALPEPAGTVGFVAAASAALAFAGRGHSFAAWCGVAAAATCATSITNAPLPHLLVILLAAAVAVVIARTQPRVDRDEDAGEQPSSFDAMMRFLPVGIFRSDRLGHLLYANPTFQTLTGLGGESTRGWQEAIAADDRSRVDAAWAAFVKGDAPFDEQFRLDTGDRQRWLNVRVTPEYERGAVAGYIGTVTDITTQRIAEDARLRTEAYSQAVLDNAVDAIITIDEAGVMRSFNKAAQRMFGYTPGEVLGRSVNMLMPMPHRRDHDRYIRNYIDTGQAKIIGIGRELEARLKSGRHIPIYLAVSEVSLSGERHFTGLIRDISAERAAAEEIRRQHEQLSLTVQNAPMGIATYRFGHPFTATNRAFQLITGYDQEQLSRMMLLDLVHVDDRPEAERLAQQSAAGLIDQYSLHLRVVRANGSIVHLATHHAVTHDAQGNPDLIIIQVEDLTGEMQAAETEREHREKLTHVARLSTLGEMTAGIAHEINQPLTAIAMYAQSGVRMLDSGNPNPARLREALVKLNAQSLRAGAVIDRIQRLVRNHDSVREMVDPNDLVTDILRLAESDARVNDIQISLDLTPRVPAVRVDPIQIQQVLLNLVRNAIDAMRSIDCEHGNHVTIRTEVFSETVRIAVVDTGTGVADEFAAQLFTPFATTKELGMGMGLSICRSIIEDHGGRLGYQNNELHGATFYFDLPRETRDDA